MGLLKALFKRKAEKLPPQSVNQPEAEVKDLEAGLETLNLQDTHGQNAGGPLPNSSTGTQQPWDLHGKHGGPLPGLLGENPLDAIVDIEATSLEAVDYTHEEEAPPIIHIIPNDQHQQRDNDNDTDEQASSASGATEQSLPSNGVEEGVQVDAEKDLATLQEDTVSDFEPEPEEQHQENFENTPSAVAAGDSASPPPPVVGDLSMLSLAPLQSVLYLTEDGENMADTISVVSGGYGPTSNTTGAGGGVDGGGSLSGERGTAELAEEIHELGKALETLEAEIPGSPLSGTAGGVGGGGGGGSLLSAGDGSSIGAAGGNTTIAQPSSPGGSMSTTSVSVADGARFSSSMVKLYNDLALRLMDAKEYDQALQMLTKAETILDNDAAWAPPAGFSASGCGSLDTSSTVNNNNNSAGGVPGLSSRSFDRNISGSFNLTNAQESSLDEAAFTAAAVATLAGMNGLQVILEKIAVKRNRLRAITYNNIGCLYKRRSLPERALPYLQNALSLEEAAGDVHDCASTHLNLCASYSALTRFREALAHAERAIILLQRQLWGPTAGSFQDGMTYLGRVLAALAVTVAAGPGVSGANGATNNSGDPSSSSTAAAAAAAATYEEAHKRQRKLLANANILAMAYHNAAVEHERLNRLREAQVSYSRACSIGTKFLGPKSSTTVALLHAQKGFVARQQREAGAMTTHHSSSGGGGGGGSGAKGHVMTSRSSTNLASKARQGSSTTKRTPLGGASSSSRMGKSSSSSIASKLARR